MSHVDLRRTAAVRPQTSVRTERDQLTWVLPVLVVGVMLMGAVVHLFHSGLWR